jgi:DNA-directed RNA polymerase subunit alpha
MRIRWRNLELPTRVIRDPEVSHEKYGRFLIEPFEGGFGHTVGNSLRRVLLSSLEGTAVVWLKIKGVAHEFSTIPGVYEDVTDIVLNVKNLLVRLPGDEPQRLRMKASKKGEIKAGDVEVPAGVEVVNPDLKLLTISEDKADVDLEMEVRKGRGYVTAEENDREDKELGVIPVDSIFSPVRRVNYRVENTRVGKLTNYDRLIMEIWTDGTITPEMGLVEASKILRKHLNPFIHYFDLGRELPPTQAKVEAAAPTVDPELLEKLQRPISTLDLSVRASNCIESENMQTIGDLVGRSEEELLAIKNFGKTTLKEISKKLEELGLTLGMDVPFLKKGV